MSEMPTYSEEHYQSMLSSLTPVEVIDGFFVKRDDYFQLGDVCGGKVRQCLSIVHKKVSAGDEIKGLVTSVGLPSPQSCITAAVAKYFSLPCAVVTCKYSNDKHDVNRINISIAQSLGADIYGIKNSRLTGIEKTGRELASALGYYKVLFGMEGRYVMEVVSQQVQNIPESVDTIVSIAGSGLSVLGVLLGLAKYQKTHVKRVYVINLSGYFDSNKAKWFDTLPLHLQQFASTIIRVRSPIEYQVLLDKEPFDWTYENKAWVWAKKNIPVNAVERTLFWVVGKRSYDLGKIVPIAWQELPEFKEKSGQCLLNL